jgi:nucleoside-diphosphate-sugar epimerase
MHNLPPALDSPVAKKNENVKTCLGVLGAASMVGECLLPLLIQTGWRVLAFSRRPVGQTNEKVEWRQIASPNPGHPAGGEDTIEAWICLAPIMALPGYFGMLEAYGARRVVALSSTSRFTKMDSSDLAERDGVASLVAAEEALQHWAEARKIEWVILRPTLIYGLGLDKNITLIAGFIRRFGFFPLLGVARGLRQPVHAGDVAQACLSALNSPQAANRNYDISGAEVLTYREMVIRVFAALGRRPRILTVPLGIFRIVLACMRVVPRYRNVSPAMAERMNRDMVFDHTAATRDFNYSPRGFSPREDELVCKSR